MIIHWMTAPRLLQGLCLIIGLALMLSASCQQVYASQTVIPDQVRISLQRPEGKPGGDPILVMEAGEDMENCADLKRLNTAVSLGRRTLFVTIRGYSILGRTAGTATTCAVSKLQLGYDVLKEAEAKIVHFTVGETVARYALQLGGTAIRLVPQKGTAKVVPDKTMENVVDPLYYWRLPPQTLALYVRDTKDPYVEKEIELFAEQKNLLPMKEFIGNFVPRYKEPNRFLFVDQQGTVFGKLKPGEFITLGGISYRRVGRTASGSSQEMVLTERIYAEPVKAMD